MTLENQTQSRITINIENVVATSSLGSDISLKKVGKVFPEAKYNPDRFPGMIIRTELPTTTILIFKTGSAVCTGATSEDMAKEALDKFAATLQEDGVIPKESVLSHVKIENIVSSCDIHCRVHLEQAARILPRSLYEPEQFPGLIHRMLDPKTVILLFASGRLVCTGAKKTQEIYNSVNQFNHLLSEKNLIACKREAKT